MNRIIYILLSIIFFQVLGIGYIKFIDEKKEVTPQVPKEIEKKLPLALNACPNSELEALVNASIKEILKASKKLPQSTEYTVWDKKTVEHLSQKILQEPKITTITVVKEKTKQKNRLTLNRKEKKKKLITKKTKVSKKKVAKKKKTISVTQKVEKYAKAKLGQKYVWGATGPNKFDCSGFTREVFRSTVGIKIPRVSREQAKVGKYIKYKDLRRGDMVFFDTEKKFTGRVNHVGIYLSHGNFIHASSARKKVIITNFRKKPFYKRRFLWGRRLVKSSS